MSGQQTVEVVEVAWRPASTAVRASLLQLLFGPVSCTQNVALTTVVGTPGMGGARGRVGP